MISLAVLLPFLAGYVPGVLMPNRRWRWIFGIGAAVIWAGSLFGLLVTRGNEVFVLLAHGLFFGAVFGLAAGVWLARRRAAGPGWSGGRRVRYHALALVAALAGYALLGWILGMLLDAWFGV